MSLNSTEIKHNLKAALGVYPDFPQPGIVFEDILPIFRNPSLFRQLVDVLKEEIAPFNPTVIVGLDARGFLFGPTIALELGIAFVPVRKDGKMPGEVYRAEYIKEYGKDVFALQKNAITASDKVVIVDDIIATGGSAAAAGELVEKAGAQVLSYVFIMEIPNLKGRDKLKADVRTIL